MFKTTIEWHEAIQISKEQQDFDIVERKRLLDEIQTSNFSMLDARDINYYAYELGYTPNEIRYIHLAAHPELTSLDLLNTFEDDDTDQIIDFY